MATASLATQRSESIASADGSQKIALSTSQSHPAKSSQPRDKPNMSAGKSAGNTVHVSDNKSTSKSADLSDNKSTRKSADMSDNKSTSKSADMSDNKSTSKSADVSDNKSTSKSADVSDNRPKSTRKSADGSDNKSTSTSADMSDNKSTSKSADVSDNKSTRKSADVSDNKSAIRSATKSVSKLDDKTVDVSDNNSVVKSASRSDNVSGNKSASKSFEMSAIKSAKVSVTKSATKTASKSDHQSIDKDEFKEDERDYYQEDEMDCIHYHLDNRQAIEPRVTIDTGPQYCSCFPSRHVPSMLYDKVHCTHLSVQGCPHIGIYHSDTNWEEHLKSTPRSRPVERLRSRKLLVRDYPNFPSHRTHQTHQGEPQTHSKLQESQDENFKPILADDELDRNSKLQGDEKKGTADRQNTSLRTAVSKEDIDTSGPGQNVQSRTSRRRDRSKPAPSVPSSVGEHTVLPSIEHTAVISGQISSLCHSLSSNCPMSQSPVTSQHCCKPPIMQRTFQGKCYDPETKQAYKFQVTPDFRCPLQHWHAKKELL